MRHGILIGEGSNPLLFFKKNLLKKLGQLRPSFFI